MIFQTSMRTCSMLIFRGIVSCDTFSYFFITASTFHDLQYRTGGGWVEPTHLKNMGTAKLDYFFQGLGWKQKILELPPPRYVYIYIPSFISFSKKTTSSNITKHSTNQNNWNFLNKKSKRLIKASPNFCEKNIPQTRFFFLTKKSTLSSNKLPRRGSEFFKRPKENMGPQRLRRNDSETTRVGLDGGFGGFGV